MAAVATLAQVLPLTVAMLVVLAMCWAMIIARLIARITTVKMARQEMRCATTAQATPMVTLVEGLQM